MDIMGNIILTPHDSGLGVEYEPDWRAKVAIAWADNDRWFPPKYIYDDWFIKHYVDYLRLLKYDYNQPIPDRFKDLEHAETIYANGIDTRRMLEPLLLSNIDIKYVAADMAPLLALNERRPEDLVRLLRIIGLYERLFFNIRDNSGKTSGSLVTRTYFALRGAELNTNTPDDRMPYVAAACFGYTALTGLFHNSMYAHAELEDIAQVQDYVLRELQAHMLCRVLKKQYNNFDSTMLLGKNIEYKKMLFDTKSSKSERNEYKGIVIDILEETAPTVLAAAQTAEERLKSNTFVMDQWTARKNVAAQAVNDAGVEGAVLQVYGQMVKRNIEDQGLTGKVK